MAVPSSRKRIPLRVLLQRVGACRICEESLPLGPRPVVQFSDSSRILIAGQAPGRRVHETGVPFSDPSGERLRLWLGVDAGTFYDSRQFAILPMGFCYPGSSRNGDLPPRPECAAAWRREMLERLGKLELTIVLGTHALSYHMPEAESLTEAVGQWRATLPGLIALPHPSPRNRGWHARNPWFEKEVVPVLKRRVAAITGR